MSAPPPGGSPPPQSPPPYPQYPPQGYPPPYPPQQPYAPPAAPPPKESHIALIIIVVVVVVVIVLALVAYFAIQAMLSPARQFTQVTITGVSFSVGGSASSYFGPSPITSCSACPKTVTVGQTFQYTLTLTNGDTASHRVTNINVTYPFILMSLSPPLPVTVSAGNSATFTLSIEAATIGGSYTLAGDIVVAA